MTPVILRLKQTRQKLGLTQKQLAEVSGVRQATISLYERNPQRVDLSNLEKLARALGVTVRSLLDERPVRHAARA